MNKYFADKANIYRWQKRGDIIIAGQEIAKKIKIDIKKSKHALDYGGRLIEVGPKNFPAGWKIKLLGEHNRQNIAYAVIVAGLLDAPEKIIKKTVESFIGIPGRLEFIREVKGIKYYNDTTATTPDGVIAALKALGRPRRRSLKTFPMTVVGAGAKIILIGGGRDKELDYKKYAGVVKKSVKALILFKGTATDKIVDKLKVLSSKPKPNKLPIFIFDNMKDAFTQAQALAQKGDIVLLSPGAASFGIFKNEFDRGDQFNKLVKGIK